jgi:hypothetical protein
MKNAEIKNTGQLRIVLANAIKGVLNGDMKIEQAEAIHKLAKNVTESLYSETKINMFQHEVGRTVGQLGELALGEPEK